MKKSLRTLFSAALAAATLVGLSACSTPAARDVPQAVAVPQITPFQQPDVDTAASAYVALYAQTVRSSLAEGRYIEPLALKHLNAESCLTSRAYRLMGKELTADDKNALLLRAVSADDMAAYNRLAKGYYARPNGLELFSCDRAGLKVDKNAIY